MARKASGPSTAARTNASAGTTTRSRTGCLTCRKRKLKCDETKPICVNCQKGQRECTPADTITFRNQQNPSLNHGTEESAGGLENFYDYKDQFRPDHVWLPVSKDIRFVYITNPYVQDPEEETADTAAPEYQQMATHSLEALSTAATRDSDTQVPLPYAASLYGGNRAMLAHYNGPQAAYVPYAVKKDYGNALSSSLIDPNLEEPAGAEHQDGTNPPMSSPEMSLPYQFKPDVLHRKDGDGDDQVATLLRKYSDGPALWMDLFDPNHYFTFQIPLLSANSPIIKYATLALAAKSQAHQVKASLAASSSVARAFFPTASAAETLEYESLTTLFRVKALDHIRADEIMPKAVAETSSTNVEILTSVALMCFLMMGNNELATDRVWKSSMAEMLAMQALIEGSSERTVSVFFELARHDCLSAFINETHALLDTENLALWQSAGLQIDAETGSLANKDTNSIEPRAATQTSCNALFWILTKIVNFLADGDCITFDPMHTHDIVSPIGVSQQTLLEKWHQLSAELDLWQKALPILFESAARTTTTSTPHTKAFAEIWYHIPMCASAMQFYHMACILLLINKPHESTARRSTIAMRLRSYVSIADEIRMHAREISGISASKPQDAVRVYSIQPLFVAGQCLENELERNSVLEMLRSIQADTGWITDYRVNQLKNEWGWT